MITPSANVEQIVPYRSEDRKVPASVDPKQPTRSREESEPVDAAKLESTLEQSGREIVFEGRAIRFNYDKDIGRVVVRVVSSETETMQSVHPAVHRSAAM